MYNLSGNTFLFDAKRQYDSQIYKISIFYVLNKDLRTSSKKKLA